MSEAYRPTEQIYEEYEGGGAHEDGFASSGFEIASVDFSEPLPLEDEEQPEEYLIRVHDAVLDDASEKGLYIPDPDGSDVSGLNVFDKDSMYVGFAEHSIDSLRKHLDNPKFNQAVLHTKFSNSKREIEMGKVKFLIRCSGNCANISDEGTTGFEHTNRSRRMFGGARGYDNIPYQQSFFSVGIKSDIAFEYLSECLNDKNILVLGGGISMNDLFFQTYRKDRKDLPEIKPSMVVNVDPFIKHESVGKSDIVPYVSIPESAADPEAVSQGLREFGIREHGFDEIWASYSVPYYLETPEEIAGMFEVITQNLAEGGIARIFPLSVSDNSETGESYDELVHQIEILNNSQDYNVYVVQNPVGSALFIRNLKQKTA